MAIFCLMGKSATGKDTIYRGLLSGKDLGLIPIVPATTRPVRSGEKPGENYNFFSEDDFERMLSEGRIAEHRSYETVHGLWRYFTPVYDEVDPAEKNYLYIGTLEAFIGLAGFYGKELVKPIYIYVADDGERLQRALRRERAMETPRYAELCRRFLSDEADFSKENIDRAGILAENMFENDNAQEAVKRIAAYIMKEEFLR